MDNTVSLQAANRVLVAEEDAVNQLVMKGLLGLLDLEHDIVPDGVSALEKFESEPAGTYGLVLTDLHMPLLDGLERLQCRLAVFDQNGLVSVAGQHIPEHERIDRGVFGNQDLERHLADSR